ncbi:MAG: Flp family type IVb pilin [Candidatus Nanopelagicales bacterium]|jgi:pilus assembly protein Flp/PilA
MSSHMRERLVRWLRHDEGVSAVEYAILVGVVAIAVVAGITAFSGSLQSYLTGLWASLGL